MTQQQPPFSQTFIGALLVAVIGGLLVALVTGVWSPAVPQIPLLGPSRGTSDSAPTSFPGAEGYVVDKAHVMTPNEESRLEEALARLDRTTCHQIALLTVPDLDNESLESFSLRIANNWGIGRSGFDNGILVLVAVRDRKARIELGYGFARRISNERAGEILNRDLVPFARIERFSKGFERTIFTLTKEAFKWKLPIAPCQS